MKMTYVRLLRLGALMFLGDDASTEKRPGSESEQGLITGRQSVVLSIEPMGNLQL